MTKKELVKIVSKKAAVVDTSAKELFDLFLRKIATELQPGESAQFSNVGYFHFRKGKVKKESTDSDGNRIEYLDLIIFSSSGQLNVKSVENLVFSLPEGPGGSEDNLDSHFSLSVGKPVLPNLEGSKSAAYSTDELQEILNRKVDSLMIILQKDESAMADSEFLLVDIKAIDQDQFELELDEEASLKNSEKSDDTIHSSEQLKSIAWSFGKDLSNQITGDTLSDDDIDLTAKEISENSEFGDRDWDEPVSEVEIDMDEESGFDMTDDIPDHSFESEDGTDDSSILHSGDKPDQVINHLKVSDEQTIEEHDELVEEKIKPFDKRIDDDFNLSGEPEVDTEKLHEDELDKTLILAEEKADEVIDLSDKKIEELINTDKLAESLLDEVDLKDLNIEMNDFEVSENNEKKGKFERVRSISSSYDETKTGDDIEGFDSFIEDRININRKSVISKSKIDDLEDSDDIIEISASIEPKKKNKKSSTSSVKKNGLQLNRTESKKTLQKYDRKSSATKFLIIFAIMVGTVGLIYLLTNKEQSSDIYDQVMMPPPRPQNTTYVERTYDIPVNYPYEKSEDDLQVAGLGPPVQAIENKPNEKIVETKPPIEVVHDRQEPPVLKTGQRPSGTPIQAAYSIYQYGNTFIVQVAAFRSESMAQQEVSNYISQGYNAFLEQANINGILWHRLRVGNFDSLEEAKQFRTSKQ